MRITLSSNLPYPIEIRRIDKQVGQDIRLRDALFTYNYRGKVTVREDRYVDDEVEITKTFTARYESPLEGSIERWLVWEGDIIRSPQDILDLSEPCKHSVQFGGMCAECGKDMTAIDMSGDAGANRASIQSAHDTDKLLISQDEATEVANISKIRLLQARKLSLVVDLDQTIIHAAVDPTIAEWQNDPENPNYEALKDVRAFQLVDDGPGMRGCWYYIKLRPGLEQFLESIAEKYELHIYTMGTRQYAKEIARLVDPERKYFDERILSRDESGSMTSKNLTRLFPVDTKMVVIIDDRADVWKWSPNLVRVKAFDFFVGIGDINAGFLPKKEDIQTTAKIEHNKPPQDEANDSPAPISQPGNGEHSTTNGEAQPAGDRTMTDTSALQQVVAMSKSDDTAMQEKQVETQEKVIASQLEDKPLLKLQQQMDEKDGVTDTNHPSEPTTTQTTDSDSSELETSSNLGKGKRHSILRNDDEELIHLERSLRAVHQRFFAEYDRERNPGAGQGGRVAALAGKQKAPIPPTDEKSSQDILQHVPDIKKVMPAMKERILGGVTIVFSGVLPLNTDIQNADISMWAKSFGARITDKVNKDTTHVIAARSGTAKVKTAVKRGIKVVSTEWLYNCVQSWKKLDEKPYMWKGIGQKELDNAKDKDASSELGAPESDPLEETRLGGRDDVVLSSEEDTSAINDTDEDGQEKEKPQKKRPKLEIEMPEDETYNLDDDIAPNSPVNLNPDEWREIDDELKDFLGSDLDSESDAESVRSDRSLATRTKKRSREDDDDDNDGESDLSGDDRHKRQKASKTSTLRAVKNAESSSDNTPRPQAVEPVDEDQTQGEYDEELAKELERQMDEAEAAEAAS